jgi:competence protein ComEC
VGAPLLVLLVAIAVGSLAGSALPLPAARIVLVLSLCLLALVTWAGGRGARAALASAAAGVGAAGAGVERAAYDTNPLRQWVAARGESDEPVLLHGRAAVDATGEADRAWLLLVDVDAIEAGGCRTPLRGRARLLVGGALPRRAVSAGDEIDVWSTLRWPRAPANPGGVDADAEALRAGVHAVGYCKTPRLVTIRSPAAAGSPRRWAALARRWARGVFARYVLPGPEQGLVRAMVLGDRGGVDNDTAQAFRTSGTYHVLALSGAQVALVTGLLLVGARRIGLPPPAAGAVVSAAIAAYAVVVGADAPVVRAALMAIVMLLGRSLDLDTGVANLLGLAGILLLVAQPSAVADVAFQLSFVATAGIVLLAPPLAAGLPRLPLRLDLGIVASLAAQLPLLPLLAGHFHRIAPAALVLNLLAVPLSSAVLVAGAAVLAAAVAVPMAASTVGDIAWMAAYALRRSGELAGSVPGVEMRVPDPPAWASLCLILGLVLVVREGRRLRPGLLIAAGVAGIAFGPEAPAGDGRLHLTVLDVGQGDGLVLRSPHGRVLMVDAGGAYEEGPAIGERVIGPYLWSQGIRRVEALLVSHAHPDHVAGAPFVLTAFGPTAVWEGPAPRSGPASRDLEQALAASAGERRTVARGMRLSWDGVAVEVLGPVPRHRGWRLGNNDSVVATFRLGGVTLLLTGDVEAPGEADLGRVPALVIKVPHHGSRTSSTPAFVAGVAPRVAIVSVGDHNHFGHPHPEVIERYVRAGALVLRTDHDGAVTISTDGERMWVATTRSGFVRRLR